MNDSKAAQIFLTCLLEPNLLGNPAFDVPVVDCRCGGGEILRCAARQGESCESTMPQREHWSRDSPIFAFRHSSAGVQNIHRCELHLRHDLAAGCRK